jgi:hypothetical protein
MLHHQTLKDFVEMKNTSFFIEVVIQLLHQKVQYL